MTWLSSVPFSSFAAAVSEKELNTGASLVALRSQGNGRQVVLVVKNLPAIAGDESLIPGSGISPGKGNGNPL